MCMISAKRIDILVYHASAFVGGDFLYTVTQNPMVGKQSLSLRLLNKLFTW